MVFVKSQQHAEVDRIESDCKATVARAFARIVQASVVPPALSA
jgi:hypothetical protein